MAMDDVVGPLQGHAREAFRFERAHDGDTHRQRQAREETRALLEGPAQREREAAAHHRGPSAAAAAAAGRLPFGRERHAMDVLALRAAHELGRRGIDLVHHLEIDGHRHAALGGKRLEPFFDRRRIEKTRRFEQAIAQPLDAFERKAGGFGVFQDLRDAGAGEAHARGKVFAGMESAIS